jgi:hypothetical protein
MTTSKPDAPEAVPAPKEPDPAPRSEALESELAMLEAILRLEGKGKAQPAPVDPPKDGRRGDTL